MSRGLCSRLVKGVLEKKDEDGGSFEVTSHRRLILFFTKDPKMDRAGLTAALGKNRRGRRHEEVGDVVIVGAVMTLQT